MKTTFAIDVKGNPNLEGSMPNKHEILSRVDSLPVIPNRTIRFQLGGSKYIYVPTDDDIYDPASDSLVLYLEPILGNSDEEIDKIVNHMVKDGWELFEIPS